MSPYIYCAGNPVSFYDEGGTRIVFAKDASTSFKNAFAATVKYMNDRKTSDNLAKLEKSNTVYIIRETDIKHNISQFVREENTIYWSPNQILETNHYLWLSPATILDHEVEHAVRYDTDFMNAKDDFIKRQYLKDHIIGSSDQFWKKEEERVITGREQRTARRHREIRNDQTTRSNYKAKVYITNNLDPYFIEIIIREQNEKF